MEKTKYRSIILMGKTGSGKGTQAKLIAGAFGYKIFSMGGRVREIASQNTSFGRRIKEIHVSGWVPEWLASYLMTRALLEEYTEDGLVLEGGARKLLEAEKFHEIHEMTERPYVVVYFDIEDGEAIKRMRLRKRGVTDSEVNIENRLRAFREETLQSLDFFKQKNTAITVNANQTEERVFADIMSLLTT